MEVKNESNPSNLRKFKSDSIDANSKSYSLKEDNARTNPRESSVPRGEKAISKKDTSVPKRDLSVPKSIKSEDETRKNVDYYIN